MTAPPFPAHTSETGWFGPALDWVLVHQLRHATKPNNRPPNQPCGL